MKFPNFKVSAKYWNKLPTLQKLQIKKHQQGNIHHFLKKRKKSTHQRNLIQNQIRQTHRWSIMIYPAIEIINAEDLKNK